MGRATKKGAGEALMYGFARGVFDWPESNQQSLFINAQPLPGLSTANRTRLVCQQGFRPLYNQLVAAGYSAVPELPDNASGFPVAIVMASRYRKVNEAMIVQAWNHCSENGMIIVAGEKTSGIQPLRKHAAGFANPEGSYAKYHAQVFWLRRKGPDILMNEEAGVYADNFFISPGMFSADGPDPGSVALAARFDSRISGIVADFGAGWGYLSARAMQKCDSIRRLDCYEADWSSLKAAQRNLAKFTTPHINFYWHDVPREPAYDKYDWIIMNPPFHTSRFTEPALGIAFVQAAARALRRGGRLLMVANRNLPYEQALAEAFQQVETISTDRDYKILEAVR
jgi:16S rRNA (guanine1207-N2)-methyltransferase